MTSPTAQSVLDRMLRFTADDHRTADAPRTVGGFEGRGRTS
jgi:hypothetical protein